MLFQKKYLIGQELVKRGKISQEDLDFALIEHERKGKRLGQMLIDCGFIKEDDLLEILAEQLGVSIQKILDIEIPKEILSKIPIDIVREYRLVPIEEIDKKLTICISSPLTPEQLEKIKSLVGKELKIVLDSDINVLKVIKKYYGLRDEDDLQKSKENSE